MRILIVNVHYSPDSFGGATIVAEQTAPRLRRRGHDVAVLTTTNGIGQREFELLRWDAEGVPVVGMAIHHRDQITLGYSNADFVSGFKQVLQIFRPDVIHFHSIQFMGVEQVEAAQSLGIPTVVTLHDAWWLCERQFLVRPSKQWCGQTAIDPRVCSTCVHDRMQHEARQQRSKSILNNCARVLTPSAFWRDFMVASGLDAERVAVNQNGVVHPPAGWERPPSVGPLRFGYVGGLNVVKGYPQIVDAFVAINRSDYELHVVDSTLNLGRASIRLADFPLTGYVKLIPGYTQATMDDFFGSIDVLLFPSQWPESYGLTVREALLRGVWPIASNLGAVAEAVQHQHNGTLVDVDDPAALAGALRWCLDHVGAIRAARPVPAMPTFEDQTDDLERHLAIALESV